MIKYLRNIPLFSDLSEICLEEIAIICKIVKYKKGEFIFKENDLYFDFYILMNGMIKIYKASLAKKESILHIIRPKESFGDVPLFEGGNYPYNARAISDSTVLYIPDKPFKTIMKNEPKICFNMLAGFAKKTRLITQKINEYTTKAVSNRLAHYLLEEIRKAGTENLPEPFVKINLSKKIISSYLGTIPDTLSRVLKKFQDENIIRISGKTIFVCNFRKLKLLAI